MLLRHWRRPATGVGSKSTATDPVSDADRGAEAAISAVLRAKRPGDAILAEESGRSAGTTGLRWVVDPLDGTVNFLYGIGHWSVSVAVEDASGTLAGVVHDPVRGELFAAARGAGATCDGAPMRVTPLADLGAALVTTGFSYVSAERTAQAEQQARLIGRIRDLRRLGSAALDLAYVAAGRVDAYVETFANPWDWAAGRLLVEEAGGRATEIPGVRPGSPGLLASGRGIHAELLAALGARDAGSP